MNRKEFSKIRATLGKTQVELSKLLCDSPKAVQSYEQGWRNIPSYIEKQMLLLLSLKKITDRKVIPCWEIKDCPQEWRANCIVWELKAVHFCWFLNGTYCQGKINNKWEQKIKICRDCKVYKAMFA